MSSFFRLRDDVKEIGTKLTDAFNAGDTDVLQTTLSEVVGEMTTGTDMSSLFPYVVKMCGTIDLTCKKLVYLYISQYATDKPDLTLLAINSLQKDASDPNAMVRGLALKTLCNIRLPEFLEYVKKPLLSGLRDRSPYVRQIAVAGSLKVQRMNPSFVKENGILSFEEMLYDPDPAVVVSVVRAHFERKRENHRSPGLRQKTAIHLFNKLVEFNDWGKSTVLKYLLAYQPQGEEEIFDILNLLDPMLESNNSSVSIAAVKLMLHYTEGMSHVQQDIYKKLRGILVNLLSHEQEELVYLSLCHLHQLQKNSCISLAKHYKKLFCRYNDPVHLKCLKMELLEMVCTDKNWKEILEELNSHSLDISSEVSDKAIESISSIARRKPVWAESSVKMLVYLLEVDRVAGSAINALKDLLDLETFQPYLSEVLSKVPSLWNRLDDQKGKIALLWIIGQHGKGLPDAPYLLESMIDNLEENSQPLVISSLLTATTKLFFTRPAECQDMLGKLLEFSVGTYWSLWHACECVSLVISSLLTTTTKLFFTRPAECQDMLGKLLLFSVVNQDDMNLKEKGQRYYQLLSKDLSLAKEVICSAKFREDIRESEENKGLNLNSLQMFFKLKNKHKPVEQRLTQPPQGTDSDTPEAPAAPMEGQLIDICGEVAEVKGHEVKGEKEEIMDKLDRVVENNDTVNTAAESLAGLSITNPTSDQIQDEPVNPTDREEVQIEGSILQLQGSFMLSPEEFESKWMSLEDGHVEKVTVTFDISSSLDILETEGISTMASTPEDVYPWKAFLYAKDKHSEAIFLMEVLINDKTSGSADVRLKSTTGSVRTRAEFQKLLEKILSKGV